MKALSKTVECRVRIGRTGESRDRRFRIALNTQQHVASKSDATAAIGMVHRPGLGRVRHFGCWRLVGATPCSFRENLSFQSVRTGESERCTNQVSWAGTTVGTHDNVQLGTSRLRVVIDSKVGQQGLFC